MATPAEIADRKMDALSEAREVIRLFLSVLSLDTEEDAGAVSALLHIEDTHAVWALARRAKEAIET